MTDPVLFAREFIEIEPHEGQIKWLTNSVKPENLLCTGNRWGKSLVQSVKILHRCIFRIRNMKYDASGRYTAVNASITMDQAKIIFQNVLRLVKGKPLLELMVNCVRWTPYPQLYFANGAVFTARSTQNRGEHLLGYDYDFFNFDEVAFELHPEYVVDEVIAMRLADREGMLDLTSTPKGKNWFYRRYLELAKRPDRCYVQQGASTENSFISGRYLKKKMQTLSEARVRQNIMGEFVDAGDEIVSEDLIQAALANSTGLSGPIEGHRYCHGWDLARKVTHTVGVTLDITTKPHQVVAIERFQGRDWDDVFGAIRKKHRLYGGPVLVDSTGLGDVVLSQVADIGAEGYNFGLGGGKAKAELLTNLQIMHERSEIAYPYFEQLGAEEYWSNLQELREATWTENGKCDFLMALALSCWIVGCANRDFSKRSVDPRTGSI
ncbi:MAG: hypothetical protein ABIK83_14555 [Candidatus Zixiibacteriota bacterium]